MTRQNASQQRSTESVVRFEDYKRAGVDTDEADAGLVRLTGRIKGTWPPKSAFGAVQLDIGYFANVIDFGGIGVAITTDGIGSKAVIASLLGKYDTVGIDCVAMNVNDLICVGATPISMVDYVAVEHVKADVLESIAVGLCQGAQEAGISISGGETAQLKDMINGFDLAGTAVGHVELDKVIVGQHLKPGDVLLGVESNGIHSNGLSLARHSILDRGRHSISHRFAELDTSVGEELLRPTYIYVREAAKLLASIKSVKALVHITSDGFLNLARVKSDVSFVIDRLPSPPPIFNIIQRLGGVDDVEMFSVFNMGIGFAAVVGPEDEERAISALGAYGKKVTRIGYVNDDPSKRVSLTSQKLVGQGKHFHHT